MKYIGPRVKEQIAVKAIFLRFSIFSSRGHFDDRSGTVLEYFSRESPRQHSHEVSMKSPWGIGVIFYVFSSIGHLVYRSRTILAILVGSHLRNIPVNFELHWPKGIEKIFKPRVQEELAFKEFVDDTRRTTDDARRTLTDHNSSP